jgi:hypothetical protein
VRKARAGVIAGARKPLVPAGGILREALDNTWRTPPRFIESARRIGGGRIDLDPATGPENPTDALAFYTGGVLPEAEDDPLEDEDGRPTVAPMTALEKRDRRSGQLARGLAVGLALRAGAGLSDALENIEGGLMTREDIHEAVDALAARDWAHAVAEMRNGRGLWRSGLEAPWFGNVWVNPPYGRALKFWLARIVHWANQGVRISAFLPCARWEQGYFHKLLRAARHVCFVRGRVAFVSSIDHVEVGGNPYASMIVGFNHDTAAWLDAWGEHGCCMELRPARKRRRRLQVVSPKAEPFAGMLFEDFMREGAK